MADTTTLTNPTTVVEWGSTHVLVEQPHQEASTNIALVSFNHLEKEATVATGDPFVCSSCRAILNNQSKVTPGKGDGKFLWVCEFCGEEQVVDGEFHFSGAVTDYLIEKPEKIVEKKIETAGLVIFLIDVSGSMGMTTEINKKYISRLEFVKSAVISHLDHLVKTSPNAAVGLITFGSSVSVFQADGIKSEIITDQMVNDYSALLEKGHSYVMDKPIKDTISAFKETVNGLSEGGTTALGPALTIGTAIAAKVPGSKCIVCTDGIANIGVGSIEGEAAVQNPAGVEFYTEVGEYAKRKGVVVSVISIKGAQTKLEKLGAVAHITKGEVDLVEPSGLNFSALLAGKVVAVNVSVSLHIPKSWEFVHKPQTDVGNASPASQLTVEFRKKHGQISPDPNFPFQVQTTFTKLNGYKYLRVYTEIRPTSNDLNAVQKI